MHFKLTIKRSGDGMNADPVLALNSQAGPRWTRGPWSPLAVPIALILLVAATFAIIRSQTNLVFDDTPGLASEIYDNGNPPRPEGVRLYTKIVKDCFASLGTSGYRPLSAIIAHLGMEVFLGRVMPLALWFCLIGLIHGATVCSVLFVAKRFVSRERWAFLAAFLFVFSAPYITAAWVVSAGIQAIVTLVVCTGLLLYWRVAERRPHCRWAVAGLCVAMLFGPWFREFIGILPVLVVIEELRRYRRPTWLMGAAALCLLHALFPTTLVRLAFFPEMPVRSIFAMGSISQTLDQPTAWHGDFIAWLRAEINNVRWLAGWHFVVLFPPLLLLLATLSFVVYSIRDLIRSVTRFYAPVASRAQLPEGSFSAALIPVACALLLIVLKYFKGDGHTIGVFLCLGIAVIAFKQSFFLSAWFLLAFLPFLKVFTEPVHLAYAMVPASIAVAAAVEKLWNATAVGGLPLRVARYAMALAVAIAIGDHALTLYGSYRVVTASNAGIVRVANWFRENTPAGSLVVGNAVHTLDVRFFANGHFVPYRTFGAPGDPQAIASPRQLEKLLAENFGHRDVYLLDMDYEFPSNKSWYHSHRFVQNPGVEKQDLGRIHVTRVRYPFLDPIRNWIQQPYITFLGPPDLENDFYHGPARKGHFQRREHSVEYHVYKVTSKKVRDYWYPDGASTLARSFNGYNILRLNSRYFAIPQRRGEFDVRKILRGRWPDCFVSDDLNEVTRRVEIATQVGAAQTGLAQTNTAVKPSPKQSAN
jgi:hypothetical protein